MLRLSHPHYLIRDTCTAPYPKVRVGRSKKGLVALRDLYFEFFGKEIQQGEHSSVEDARATMEIYRQVEKEWEADLKNHTFETTTGRMIKENFPERNNYCNYSFSWCSVICIFISCIYLIVKHYATD